MPNNKHIKVITKDVYGKPTYYPNCAISRMVCDIAGQRTLTTRNIQILKIYGYEVSTTREEVAL